MEHLPHHAGPSHVPKQFVLCFDGTGNKFAGDESDSNVLKIFRMLDRSQSHQYHYYQPGIGTYVSSNSLSSHGRFQRIKSAYQKAKDSAVGSSFDEHVMGGYKFLMRYYSPGDDIYFIGFSRGAYIARFLAEMLDYIGLLEAGNEELIRFAWKTFAKWQQRLGDTKEEREQKKKLFHYMKAFRETFSRPISRIRFMGLFDTVNSVPRFETAWMERTKFPYTARSSAKVIRQAVAIDERRAKFRQDLISGKRPDDRRRHHHYLHRLHLNRHHLEEHMAQHVDAHHHLHIHHQQEQEHHNQENADGVPAIHVDNAQGEKETQESVPKPGLQEPGWGPSLGETYYHPHSSHPGSASNLAGNGPSGQYRPPSATSLAVPNAAEDADALSVQLPSNYGDDDDDDQDIHEIWFAGGHADIGGGWGLAPGEKWALAHPPLVWMVHEARRAGLQLDERKMKQFQCLEEFDGDYTLIRREMDELRLRHENNEDTEGIFRSAPTEKERSTASRDFWHALHTAMTKGVIHDSLEFGSGLPPMSIVAWRIMEWLPFRRMDLQPDGSWKPISWPLPRGEVRDFPFDAEIHVSVIRRMQADPNYRPGNIIVGGGGRGVRKAPPEYGMGEWVICKNEGDELRETYVRKPKNEGHPEQTEQTKQTEQTGQTGQTQ